MWEKGLVHADASRGTVISRLQLILLKKKINLTHSSVSKGGKCDSPVLLSVQHFAFHPSQGKDNGQQRSTEPGAAGEEPYPSHQLNCRVIPSNQELIKCN